ncbi:MAG TPA: hypothetical protein VG188_01345 [Solirubrobacteraceae bacterium]|jgi:hypothetical protein|nr:hypothetical protein [Solirubrobacteraceae bacterium]
MDNLENGAGSEHERLRQFNADVQQTLATLRRRYHREMHLLPVPIGGSTDKGSRAGYYAMRLRDGSLGYVQRRADDCLQAAIASCLQIPMHQVPDLQVNRQLDAGKEAEEINRGVDELMARWLASQGVQLVVHSGHLPTMGRWIGVVRGPVREEFANDHCLLMSGRECLLETSKPIGALDRTVRLGFEDVDYGITIE